MSIHPDIEKAIRVIDQHIQELLQKVESLRQTRDTLVQQFGMDGATKFPTASSSVPYSRHLVLTSPPAPQTSKDKIAEFLRSHAPASRGEIVNATGIPEGTVSYALNDRDRFYRTEKGWFNVKRPEPRVDAEYVDHDETAEGGQNKTELARQFFRERVTDGGTTRDLKHYLEANGAGDNEKFPYSAVARLKKQAEIELRNGRYYPTSKLVAASAQTLLH